jgi:GT2 family glycosyltransferase
LSPANDPGESGSRDDLVISVICTNNRGALETCLEALPDAAAGTRWRATVVDNASTDGTAAMVREQFPWATLISNSSRLGFSANHNKTLVPLIDDSSARYGLILNDDTILDPGSLALMVAEMDSTADIGALGPRIRGTDGVPQDSLLAFPAPLAAAVDALRPGRFTALPAGRPGWLNGSCVMLRLQALRAVGTLDERFFIFFEDTDLGLRLLRGGWTSKLSRDAGMVHLEHSTVSMPALTSAMARQMTRSQWLYLRKHHGPVAAAYGAAVGRLAFGLRALKASVAGRVRRDGEERARAVHLLALARYSPTQPLEHEAVASTQR